MHTIYHSRTINSHFKKLLSVLSLTKCVKVIYMFPRSNQSRLKLRRVNQLCSNTDDDRDIRVNLSQGKVKLVRNN